MLQWSAARSCAFLLGLLLALFGVGLYESVDYARRLIDATRDPDPFGTYAVSVASASDDAAGVGANAASIIATTRFAYDHYATAKLVPAFTLPLLFIVRPRPLCARFPDKASRNCSMAAFLDDFDVLAWWAVVKLCINLRTGGRAAWRSAIGDPDLLQYFPKLTASDNSSVNIFVWLDPPHGGKVGTPPLRPREEREMRDGIVQCMLLDRDSGNLSSSSTDMIENITVVHLHDSLNKSRLEATVTWPLLILGAIALAIIFVAFSASQTFVSSEIKATFVSLLRTEAGTANNNNNPQQQQQQQQRILRDGGYGTAGVGATQQRNSGTRASRLPSLWSDLVLQDVACLRTTARAALHSLMSHWAGGGGAGTSQLETRGGEPVSLPHLSHYTEHSNSAAAAAAVPPPLTISLAPPSLSPSHARKIVLYIFSLMWLIVCGGVLPFCMAMAATRLVMAIKTWQGDTTAYHVEITSAFFLPTMLLVALVPVSLLHVVHCAKVIDCIFVRDLHADFAAFIKHECVWAKYFFSEIGWSFDATVNIAERQSRAAAAAAATATGGGGGGPFAGFSSGGDGVASSGIISPRTNNEEQQYDQRYYYDATRQSAGGGSFPRRHQQQHRYDDDDDESYHDFSAVVQQQQQRFSSAGNSQHHQQHNQDHGGDDNSNSASSRIRTGVANFCGAICLPLLVPARAALHCPLKYAERSARKFLAPVFVASFLMLAVVGAVLLAEGTFALVGSVTLCCATFLLISIGLVIPACTSAFLGTATLAATWCEEILAEDSLLMMMAAEGTWRLAFEHSSTIHAAFVAFRREREEYERDNAAQEQQKRLRLLNEANGDDPAVAAAAGAADGAAAANGDDSQSCFAGCRKSLRKFAAMFDRLAENKGSKRRLLYLRWAVLVVAVLLPAGAFAWLYTQLTVDACAWEHFPLGSQREEMRRELLTDNRSAVMMPYISLFSRNAPITVMTAAFFDSVANAHFTIAHALAASKADERPLANSVWDVTRNNFLDRSITVDDAIWLEIWVPAYKAITAFSLNAELSTALAITVPPFDPFGSVVAGLHDDYVSRILAGMRKAGGRPLPSLASSSSSSSSSSSQSGPESGGNSNNKLPPGANFVGGVTSGTAALLVQVSRVRQYLGFFWPIQVGSILAIMLFVWTRVDFRIVSVLRHNALRKRLARGARRRNGGGGRNNAAHHQNGSYINGSDEEQHLERGGYRKNDSGDDDRSTSASTFLPPDDDATDPSEEDAYLGPNSASHRQQQQQQRHRPSVDASATPPGSGRKGGSRNRRGSKRNNNNSFSSDSDNDSNSSSGSFDSSSGMRSSSGGGGGGNATNSPTADLHSLSAEAAAGQAFFARMKTTCLVALFLLFNTTVACSFGLFAAVIHATYFTPGCDQRNGSSNGFGASSSSSSSSSSNIVPARISFELIRTCFFPGIAQIIFLLESVDFWSYVQLPFMNRRVDVEKLLQLVSQHTRAKDIANEGVGGPSNDSALNSPAHFGYNAYLHYASSAYHGPQALQHQQQQDTPRAGSFGRRSAGNDSMLSGNSDTNGGASTANAGGGIGAGGAGGAGGGGSHALAGRSAAVDACGSNSLRNMGMLCSLAVFVFALVYLVVALVKKDGMPPVLTQFWLAAGASAAWKCFVINPIVHPAQRHWSLNLSLFA